MAGTHSTQGSTPTRPFGPAEVAAVVAREFSATFHVLLSVRFLGVLLLGIAAALFALEGEAAWKVWVPAVGAGLVLVLTLRDRRRPAPASYPPRQIAAHLLVIICAQFIIITLTGGIQSPLLLLIPVVTLAMALVTGHVRTYFVAMLVPLTLVWSLFALDAAGYADALLPPVLRGDGRGFAGQGWTLLAATALTLLMTVAGTMALLGRRAFERAVLAAATARAEALETMRARNEELQALSGALAHELKNPLASIQGLAGLLARKLPAGEREAEHVRVLIGEVKRMGSILDEFLNFSRPARGLAVVEVPAAKLVRDVAPVYEDLAARRGVRLTLAIETERAVLCDPRKVKQVLVNLIDNALDAVADGGAVSVRVAAGDDGAALIEVCDDGPGLAPAVRERLFTVGTTTKDAGSGLGLVIARAIAEQHGGALTLVDRAAGGCCAALALPARPRDVDGADAGESAGESARENAGQSARERSREIAGQRAGEAGRNMAPAPPPEAKGDGAGAGEEAEA
jgi:signal transduction histidine kinase